jgi:D-alanyl-D-alanine carboxypeptidase/D-alanyl-D-alanine-endopeptidase (penicillin-binding protein 4)
VTSTPPPSRRAAREQSDAVAGPSFARRHRIPLLVLAGVLAFALLATGALYAGAAVGARNAPAAPAAATSAAPPVETERSRPGALPSASALRTCSVSTLAKDERLAGFRGTVLDLASGTVLFSRKGDNAIPGVGAMSLVTAAAAVEVLGPDYSLETTVFTTPTPGQLVIVGGGDPTLSRTGLGEDSVYPAAPKLADLAAQVRASIGAGSAITEIVVDAGYWDESEGWLPSWPENARTSGVLGPVTALQVDGGRADPEVQASRRSSDPVTDAGEYFAEALGADDAALTRGSLPEGSTQVASVQSRPVSELVETMIDTGDASLAEALGRVISLESGNDGTAASVGPVLRAALVGLIELPEDVADISDASGTSPQTRTTSRFVTGMLARLQDEQEDLGIVTAAIPIAGEPGALEERFTGSSAAARSWVRAVPAEASGIESLAGLIDAADGTELAFDFSATGDGVGATAQAALDALAAAVYSCGSNLSNH